VSELEVNLAGSDLARVARALDEQDRKIPKDAQKEIVEEGRRRVRMAQTKVQGLPVKRQRHHSRDRRGLRRDVASGVELTETPTGVHVTTSMPRASEAVIPRGMDTRSGWRHPVFGRTSDRWVGRREEYSWFQETFEAAQVPLTEALHEVLEDAAGEIDAAAQVTD
jgi:hypothetical protein